MLKHTHTKTLMKKMPTAEFQQSSCLKQNHFTYNWTFKLWFWLILWVLRDSRSLCFQMWALTDTSSSCRWLLESSVERESSKCNTSKENEWIVKSGWFQTWAVLLCFLCSRPMTTDIITCKRHILSCDLWVVWHVSEVSTDLSRPSSLSKRQSDSVRSPDVKPILQGIWYPQFFVFADLTCQDLVPPNKKTKTAV